MVGGSERARLKHSCSCIRKLDSYGGEGVWQGMTEKTKQNKKHYSCIRELDNGVAAVNG